MESHVAGEVVPTQSAPGQNTPGLDRGKMRTIVENTYEVSQSFIWTRMRLFTDWANSRLAR